MAPGSAGRVHKDGQPTTILPTVCLLVAVRAGESRPAGARRWLVHLGRVKQFVGQLVSLVARLVARLGG